MVSGIECRVVLLVDDDRDIREVLSDALESEGYCVMAAADGLEAIDALREAPRPCVILLDLMMPRMDGWQFRAEQSRDPTLEGIPVVILSADTAVAAKAKQLKAAGHLRKPVPLDALLDAVRAHCG